MQDDQRAYTMRTKERERIWHLKTGVSNLGKQTPEVIKWFPFYRRVLSELTAKCGKLYKIYLAEGIDTKRCSAIKRIARSRTIQAVLKLKRAVALDVVTKRRTAVLQRLAEYTFSDFNRPAEGIRIKRFYEVLNASKRIKDISQFGVTKKELSEAEEAVIEYMKESNSPLERKKERARQAKQCRKMLKEIHFIIHKKLKPFFENIEDQYEIEARVFASFLKPVKMGRPPGKPGH